VGYAPSLSPEAKERAEGLHIWRTGSPRDSLTLSQKDKETCVVWQQGGGLIAQGYSESRLNAFGNQTRRFIQFCELDGYGWESASRHAVVSSWLAYLYETT
jgi:hypothetical protein